MNYVIAVWLGAAVVMFGLMILDDVVHHGPVWLQTWWNQHVRDYFPYSEEDWWAN